MVATGYGAVDRVAKAGDTMTGNLILPGNPGLALGAVPEQYVDDGFAGVVVYTSSWPARPTAPGTILWVGPSAPPTGAGGASGSDVWINTTPGGGSALTLDGTNSDIQPLGIPTAGSSGEAADAKHVHPMPLIPTGVKTSAYTASNHDFIPVDTSGGNVAITLPTAPPDHTTVAVKMVNQSGSNHVSVAAGGSDVFDFSTGGASKTLTTLFQSSVYQYGATAGIWYTINGFFSLTSLEGVFIQGTTPSAPAGFKPADPATTTSATLVMMGYGATCAYTPTGTGIVEVHCSGYAGSNGGTSIVTVAPRYGTGTAPANGVAVPGPATRFGAVSDPEVRSPGTSIPAAFAFNAMLNLTPATAYWFDVAISVAANTGFVTCTSMTFTEH